MKKLMTALAVCLAAGFAVVVDGGVVSENIVGYLTKKPQDGIISFGVSLKQMTTTNFVVSSSKVFDYTCMDKDIVLVLNATDGAFDTYSFVAGQWYFTSNQGGADVPVASFTIPFGDCVYLVVAGETVTLSGEVKKGTTQVVFDPAENPLCFWPLVNPLPIETKLSDLSFVQDKDVVLVLNTLDGAFDTYSYVSGQWYFTSNQGGADIPQSSSTVVLPAGLGGYFLSNGTGTRTWTVTL